MKESDQLMTSFITPFGLFCYVTMPFGLKTWGLHTSIVCSSVYIDDIVVKSKQADQLIADLEQTFPKLRSNGIKLNPEKCIFGVPRGMLLGFIVSERCIEANPKTISAITRMGPIQNLKGV